jgi:ABC-2 type transport system permease protein
VNLKRVRAIASKEFIQIWRDPRSLGLALGIPIFMLITFGYGLSLDIDHVRTVVWNQDPASQLTEKFLLNFKGSKYFNVIKATDNYRDIVRMMNDGSALMAIVVPKHFSRYLESGDTAPLQLIIDGSDANTATIVKGYVQSVVANFNTEMLNDMLEARGIYRTRSFDPRTRIWYNMGLESTWFIVPGVIAMIIMVVSALVTSTCIAREWERGTMEQLISTPVKTPELIIGKFLPYFAIGFFDLTIGVVMSTTLFHVPFRGSLALMVVLSILFLTGSVSQGLLISIVARTQLMASQLASLTTMIPTILLSGFIYPIFIMPKALQFLTYLIPARYFVTILRSLYLKGVGITVLWDEALFLSLFAFCMLWLAISKFSKKVA